MKGYVTDIPKVKTRLTITDDTDGIEAERFFFFQNLKNLELVYEEVRKILESENYLETYYAALYEELYFRLRSFSENCYARHVWLKRKIAFEKMSDEEKAEYLNQKEQKRKTVIKNLLNHELDNKLKY